MPPTTPSKTLETFPNPQPDRDYIIEIEAPEFTCLCPKTGQPDFATLLLEYVPDRLCVELKSLKLYVWSYRDEGHFHEKVTNTILNDLVAATKPRYMRLRALFNVRGGVYTTVTTEYRRPGWRDPPPPPDDLPREVQSAARAGRPESAPAAPAKRSQTTASAAARAPAPATPSPPAETGAESDESSPTLRSERFRMLRRKRQPITETPSRSAEKAVAAPPAPKAPARPKRDAFIGIDIGTSGCRAIAIDSAGAILAQAEAPLPASRHAGAEITQDPAHWWNAMHACLNNVTSQIDAQRVQRLALAGTSATLLLCDKQGNPLTSGLMYNDARAQAQAEHIAAVADARSAAHGATGSLAKLLWLQNTKPAARAAHALHQADWLAGRLTGVYGHSDYNNCLKLGFDVERLAWPDWFASLEVRTAWLPQVHAPGEAIATLAGDVAGEFGLSPETEVAAGTSDGVASFLAAGATAPGHGVTSLGSTLVLKLLSERPVFSPPHGVYSHRLGRYFLAGGASNTGGAVLRQYFSEEQMNEMVPLLTPDQPTELEYYPLPDVGERFPLADPEKEPRLEPLPGDSVAFFQGILEGIARIEAQGYQLLAELGAPKVSAIWTTGSGSRNPGWTRIRERQLGVRLQKPRSEHAAYGAALLAAGVVQKNFA